MKSLIQWFGVVAALMQSTAIGEEFTEGEKLFALHVESLLQEKCVACHGKEGEKIKGGLELTSLEKTLKGGEYFAEEVLIPGDASKSYLYLTTTREVEDYEMPVKESEALSQEEQWYLRDWINAGAPWPDDERIEKIRDKFSSGVIHPTSGGQSEDWTNRRYEPENLWAYQPRQSVTIPENYEGHPIDYFIGQRLSGAKLEPAPMAEKRTLIRRIYFNLHGLPPTPEQMNAALTMEIPSLVDELQASPRYGEQYARHWLDVARYADSAGFANDFERPNTWRYRDYVIRSFNDDKPYDQFIREQIAGDEIDPDDPEMLIATGFLRMGPWEQTSMSVAKVTRQQWLDDVTDTVGQVFLGHALQCARCHDHKFDPVPTQDFYSMQAIFATTQFGDRDTKWLPEENLSTMEEDKRYHQIRAKQNSEESKRLSAKKAAKVREFFVEKGLPYKTVAEAKEAGLKGAELPEGTYGMTADDLGQSRIVRKNAARFSWEFDRYKPIAYSVFSGKTKLETKATSRRMMPKNPLAKKTKGEFEQTAILAGGDPFSPSDQVVPAVLSAVPGAMEVKLPETPQNRRKALAEWIADPENSLTARVIANRIWALHFGQGIAGNPNNFGATGSAPSHPQLLDHLANYLVDHDWSIKALNRYILGSRAYQRSTRHPDPEAVAKSDPTGKLYAVFKPRRLVAEEFRDAMLSASGELSLEMGGIPIRPDINMEAALQPRMIMGTFAPSYVPNPTPDQRNRRTIYAQKTRGLRDPFMEIFNQPTPDTSCELRETSTVTPQVFSLFNGEESYDRALALAHRVTKSTADKKAAIEQVFQLTLSRQPTHEESVACLSHWNEMEQLHENTEPVAREFPTEVVRTAQEETVGKHFTFIEPLFVYRDYIPDLQPTQVDVSTRALADVCLVLINSNEFAYVY